MLETWNLSVESTALEKKTLCLQSSKAITNLVPLSRNKRIKRATESSKNSKKKTDAREQKGSPSLQAR